MKKMWFDDWLVKYRTYSKYGKGRFEVRLPNAYGKTKMVYIANNRAQSDRLNELVMIIDCCLTELTKKKWYQFWRKL